MGNNTNKLKISSYMEKCCCRSFYTEMYLQIFFLLSITHRLLLFLLGANPKTSIHCVIVSNMPFYKPEVLKQIAQQNSKPSRKNNQYMSPQSNQNQSSPSSQNLSLELEDQLNATSPRIRLPKNRYVPRERIQNVIYCSLSNWPV